MFEKLGVVRQRAHVTGSQGQHALPPSSQGLHSGHVDSATQSTFGSPIKSPGFNPLPDGAPGENTRQRTHDKLTTEPAKDPFRKDIGLPLITAWLDKLTLLHVELLTNCLPACLPVLLSSVLFCTSVICTDGGNMA